MGLCVVGKMGAGDLVTITGAAGGTGLAATELSLASGNEVCELPFLRSLLVDGLCSTGKSAKVFLGGVDFFSIPLQHCSCD